jgi:hypothetical protein
MNSLPYKDFIARIKLQKQVVDIKRQLVYAGVRINDRTILAKLYNMNRKARIEMGYKYKDFNHFYKLYRDHKYHLNTVLNNNPKSKTTEPTS